MKMFTGGNVYRCVTFLWLGKQVEKGEYMQQKAAGWRRTHAILLLVTCSPSELNLHPMAVVSNVKCSSIQLLF